MTEGMQEATAYALEEVMIISSIMIRLTRASMAAGEPVVGPELNWLAEQLDRAMAEAMPSPYALN